VQLSANNIEARLMDEIRPLRGVGNGHYVVHYHLSELQDHYRSEFQIRIAINILNDIFRESAGQILKSRNGDIFVVFHGSTPSLINKATFQLRYLFVDDPLANHADGKENEDFCDVYNLARDWNEAFSLAKELSEAAARKDISPVFSKGIKTTDFTPLRLHEIIEEVQNIDFSPFLRKQPICILRKGKDTKIVFHELYVLIQQLRDNLSHPCNLLSHPWLFKTLTEALDLKVLDIIGKNTRAFLTDPVSINLNVRTILTDSFGQFLKKINTTINSSIIVEIQMADVYSDMSVFKEAAEILKKNKCKLAIDGVNNDSMLYIDRTGLGFDLAKLQWNADFASDLGTEQNKKLAAAVAECGPTRLILCRCDTRQAIDYGNALGISLFQGRYVDRVVNPNNLVIN
jgi:EAL domain-containing protein (putative c-di-GMP-specific phosphodiesterase class I)